MKELNRSTLIGFGSSYVIKKTPSLPGISAGEGGEEVANQQQFCAIPICLAGPVDSSQTREAAFFIYRKAQTISQEWEWSTTCILNWQVQLTTEIDIFITLLLNP